MRRWQWGAAVYLLGVISPPFSWRLPWFVTAPPPSAMARPPSAAAVTPDASSPADVLKPISAASLRVTEGTVQPLAPDLFAVRVPKMRAVLEHPGPQAAELRFRYLGPTAENFALASGMPRRQVGLKLQAQDACNVIYIMWRLAPRPGVVVSIKHNPGLHASRECGSDGYTVQRPQAVESVPIVTTGSLHRLRAELENLWLTVYADGQSVWQGTLPAASAQLHGPVGIRSDNGAFELQLWVPRT